MRSKRSITRSALLLLSFVVFDNMQISSITSMFQTHNEPAFHLQNSSRTFPFSGNLTKSLFSLRAHSSERWRRMIRKIKEYFERVLSAYEIRLQKAYKGIFKNIDVITALTLTVTRLQQSKHKLMVEEKSFVLDNAEPMNKSKHAPHGIQPVRQEKIAISITRNILGHAIEEDIKVSCSVKRNVSKLHDFSDYRALGWLIVQIL